VSFVVDGLKCTEPYTKEDLTSQEAREKKCLKKFHHSYVVGKYIDKF
jgi:hypothetical protein